MKKRIPLPALVGLFVMSCGVERELAGELNEQLNYLRSLDEIVAVEVNSKLVMVRFRKTTKDYGTVMRGAAFKAAKIGSGIRITATLEQNSKVVLCEAITSAERKFQTNCP